MIHRRFALVMLAAAAVLGSLGISESNAFWRRAYVAPSAGMYYYYYPVDPGYGYSYGPYSYNPYYQPLPAAGFLPLPLATQNMLYGPGVSAGPTTANDYLFAPPRSRPSIYPAVPYDKTPSEKQSDLRRVRFEITVPYPNAVVKFDGAATKQTGLSRVFMTPPMQEDKQYTVTIVAQWPTPEGTLSAPRTKTFTVVAGETVQHEFKE